MLLLLSYIIVFIIQPTIHATEEGGVGDRSPASFSITSVESQKSVRDVSILSSQYPTNGYSAYDRVCCANCAEYSAKLELIRAELRSSAAPPRDCTNLPCNAPNGVYLVKPGLDRQQAAYCEVDKNGHGWILIQHRADIKPRLDFYRGWDDYKWGFGDLHGEFWWGLEYLWLTTSMIDRRYELRIDMQDFKGNWRFAKYSDFKVASEADAYRLTVTNYTGDAGDSMTYHSGAQFTTKDKDHDNDKRNNCAHRFKGAWWYDACHYANLNGQYLVGHHSSFGDGVNWRHWMADKLAVPPGDTSWNWPGYRESLKIVKMMIRST